MIRPQDFGSSLPNGSDDNTADLQAALNAAVSSGDELYLSPGTWRGNISASNVTGVRIRGDSRGKTKLQGILANTPTLKLEGLWYSNIRELTIETSLGQPNNAVFAVDKSATQGVQGNTYDNLLINGQGVGDGQKSKFAMSMCEVGSSSAQGSEQNFLNCHFSGATQACYYQIGYNALNNQFVGGNFQNYTKHGIQLVFGSLHLFGVGFQSVSGYQQILNDGWDIVADSGGVGDSLVIAGCRTESLRFFKGNPSQPPCIMSCLQRSGLMYWYPNTVFSLGDAVQHENKLYICDVGHTSGLAFDAAKWDEISYNVVEVYDSVIENSNFQLGKVLQLFSASDKGAQVNANYNVPYGIKHVLVDASSGEVDVILPDPAALYHGHEITVIKGDSSSNVVRVHSLYFNNEFVHQISLTAASRRTVLKSLGGGTLPRRFYEVT